MEIKEIEFVNLSVKVDGCLKTLQDFAFNFVPKTNSRT